MPAQNLSSNYLHELCQFGVFLTISLLSSLFPSYNNYIHLGHFVNIIRFAAACSSWIGCTVKQIPNDFLTVSLGETNNWMLESC